ncbi:uncharacterized protein LOC119077998 [Bradysia coprophila]|uniref:uncharacterized protein LOC119077998 n=1 Tax=Bradysia coprophila TaxID=38358 RepID=UPI00187D8530|nr:uncharacterized protein LOC119077998 [Bradysia coprophila]XP_037041274.1 uncharacterized protein LOC119077998 [Bradysia coprophila]
MITVDSCLCFKLETGGLIIGWLSIIGNLLFATIFAIFVILLCVFSCQDMAEQLDLETCNSFRGVFIGVFVVIIILCILVAYAAWKLIQGTKARDHFKVKPMMILLGIVTVLSALQILTLTAAGIVNGLIQFVVDAYFFVVIYSLYDRFRTEYESGGNNRPNLQYQAAGKV